MRTLVRHAARLDAGLGHIEQFIAIACLIVIVVATALGVFFRYVLNDPLIWSNSAGILALMWLTFIGGSLLFKSDAHINISAIPSMLSPRAWSILSTVFSVFILITVLLIAWQMLTLIPLQVRKQIEALSLPRSVYGIPLMWAMLSIGVSALVKILKAMTDTPLGASTNHTAGI